jgi:RNA polymerase sigma-70 factor (ECF subfamily)
MSAATFADTFNAPWSVLGRAAAPVRLPRPLSRKQPADSPEVNARAFEPGQSASLSLEGQQLVAARRQDPAAFEALVRRHQGAIYNFCLHVLGQSDDAADVAQETFVRLFTHLSKLDEREPIAPWLFRVARNRCIDVIRRRRTVPLAVADDTGETSLIFEPADDDPLPDELAERADLQRVLAAAIAHLPPAYAEVVSLRYTGDLSFAEIGAVLDCDEGAARVRFHRAKALLRRHLRESAAGD